MSNTTNKDFLNLVSPLPQNPDQVGKDLLVGFIGNQKLIGERYIKVHKARILNNIKSVHLFEQAERLYCFGLFDSAIMVSRSTAEYIASELLRENLSVIKDEGLLKNFIVDSIDFRKIVNDFLYKNKIISKEIRKNFNDLYELGNNYVHPKSKSLNPEEDALKAVTFLGNLISSLRNVLNEYDINNGILVEKTKL